MLKLLISFLFVYMLLMLLKNVIKFFFSFKKASARSSRLKEKDISNEAEVIQEKRFDQKDH